jgi:hypothetical protein
MFIPISIPISRHVSKNPFRRWVIDQKLGQIIRVSGFNFSLKIFVSEREICLGINSTFRATSALIPPIECSLKSKNFIFRNFLKNHPIRGNLMRETRWRCYFCVKTLPFFRKSNFLTKKYIFRKS